MASRLEVARALSRLRSAPGYREYVQVLEAELDTAVQKVILAPEAELLDARAYLRVLSELLSTIHQNEVNL